MFRDNQDALDLNESFIHVNFVLVFGNPGQTFMPNSDDYADP